MLISNCSSVQCMLSMRCGDDLTKHWATYLPCTPLQALMIFQYIYYQKTRLCSFSNRYLCSQAELFLPYCCYLTGLSHNQGRHWIWRRTLWPSACWPCLQILFHNRPCVEFRHVHMILHKLYCVKLNTSMTQNTAQWKWESWPVHATCCRKVQRKSLLKPVILYYGPCHTHWLASCLIECMLIQCVIYVLCGIDFALVICLCTMP